MIKLEDRLRRDLPAVADLLIDEPTGPDETTQDGNVRPGPRPFARTTLVAAAAVLALVVGLVAVSELRTATTPQVATAPVASDRPAEMFLLPTGNSGLTITNAEQTTHDLTSVADQLATETVVVGVPLHSSFSKLATVTSTNQLLALGGGWNDVDGYGGSVKISGVSSLTAVAKQLGDAWITVQTGAERRQEALEILQAVTVSEAGSLSIDLPGVNVLERSTGPHPLLTAARADIVGGTLQGNVEIEITTSTSPLAYRILDPDDVVTAVKIGTTPGWSIHQSSLNDDWNSVVWQLTRTHIAVLSGTAPLPEQLDIAQNLRPATEAEWLNRSQEPTSVSAAPTATSRGD